MKICFLGDSITNGAGASKYELCYVEQVRRKLGCEVENFGIGGTRIAIQRTPSEESFWDERFMLRARKMGDADFVFVFGGTNDYGHGDAMLGELGDKGEDTFCGAFYSLAKYLLEKYGREKLCFILPIPRYNMESIYGDADVKRADPRFSECDLHSLSEYVSREVEILSEFGISYLDLSEYFPEPKTSGASDLFVDGLHPNDKGHSIIAEKICEFIKKA